MKLQISAVSAFLLLAGCAAPVIPDDAQYDTYDGLPGGELWGWIDQENANFTVIHGHFEYAGKELLLTAQEDPRGAWNLTILAEDGRDIIYDDRPSRKAWYQTESYQHEEEFQFTWLHDEYERYEQAGTSEDLPSYPVPAGNYTVILQFMLAADPDDSFEVRLNLPVQSN